MTFLPVVERELRVASRRRYTYWTRFFAALGTITLCTWIWGWLTDGQPAADRGQSLFRTIAALAFVYSLFVGIATTADCLSEEKRDGTLGLLFLTDLTGYDVVFGKLTATSLNSFYRLISVFPILAIPLLLGALSLGEFWRMTLVLTNTLFFSLSAGIIVSAVSRKERQARAGALLLIVLSTGGPALLGLVQVVRNQSIVYNPAWLLSSTAYAAYLVFDPLYKVNSQLFWSAVATTHLLAWGFLAGASIFVRHTWQDRLASGSMALSRDRWANWRFGRSGFSAKIRQRILDLNPISWRTSRDRMIRITTLAVLGALGLLWLWLFRKFGRSILDPMFYIATIYIAHSILKIWVASEACRPLAEERRSGSVEMLLSTPLTVEEILEGLVLGLKRQFGAAVVLVLVADLIILLAGMSDSTLDSSPDWLFVCLALMVIFITDLFTLAWVGFWLSLTAKSPSRATVGAILRVLVLPWGVFILGLSLVATAQWQSFEPGELGLLTAGPALALLNNAFFFSWARKNLLTRFREVATQRFDLKLSESAHPPGVLVEPTVTPPVPAG